MKKAVQAHRGKETIRVLLACGMTNKKLAQKIAPLQANPRVREILLLRKETFEGEKIVNYTVPPLLRKTVLTAEPWRLATAFYLGLFRRPDVGICMTLMVHGVHVYLLKLVFGVPAVFHIMGKQDLQLHRPDRRLWRKLLWKFSLQADVIVVRGEATRQLYLQRGGKKANSVFVQHNVFDFGSYRPDRSVQKKYDLVYVGYLAAYKSVNLLLEIAALLRKSGRPASLVLVGSGPLQQTLEREARALKIEREVTFTGHLEERQLIEVLQQSRVFVMTSLGEGLPQAMIEAMSCGLPPVLFDDADVREIITPGRNGILVPPGDTEAFSREVKKLLTDDEHYARIAEGALRIREEFGLLFSLETQKALWQGVLDAALREREAD